MEPLLPDRTPRRAGGGAADSSLMRVHQHGATARRVSGNAATVVDVEGAGGEPGPVPGAGHRSRPGCRGDLCWVEPDDHSIGRLRGGLTTKLHMLTDGHARPLVLLLTAGNINDCPTFPQLIYGLRVACSAGWAYG